MELLHCRICTCPVLQGKAKLFSKDLLPIYVSKNNQCSFLYILDKMALALSDFKIFSYSPGYKMISYCDSQYLVLILHCVLCNTKKFTDDKHTDR